MKALSRCNAVAVSCVFFFFVAHGLLFAQDQVNDVNAANAAERIKVLIVDGQNNHGVWPKTTEMMKSYLEQTGLFTVDVARTAPKGVDDSFAPEFSKFDVVLSNYNGADWPESTQKAFEKFIEDGGGLVVVHAADNAFPDWSAYNEMIGLGGWGNRNARSGPYLYYDSRSQLVRDTSEGPGGSHGPQHDFLITKRDNDHPIMKDLPEKWLHAKDELYDRLRGPAENVRVLATAWSDQEKNGTGRNEPMVLVIEYGQGRVFHTTLGHEKYSQECVGFITLLQRGTEWAATGKVTIPVPDDFPTEEKTSSREFK
jgi:type 1 glutamine amidotransferase